MYVYVYITKSGNRDSGRNRGRMKKSGRKFARNLKNNFPLLHRLHRASKQIHIYS